MIQALLAAAPQVGRLLLGLLAGEAIRRGGSAAITRTLGTNLAGRAGASLGRSAAGNVLGRGIVAAKGALPRALGKRLPTPTAIGGAGVDFLKHAGAMGAFMGGIHGVDWLIGDDQDRAHLAPMLSGQPIPDRAREQQQLMDYRQLEALRQALEDYLDMAADERRIV